jgi:cytochrome d ubiquinol oxidase subunit II
MLGRYITGFEEGAGYMAFAVITGASLCGGYVLLGATWLILRTEDGLQKKAFLWARWGLLWVALGIALVSIATPLVSETVRTKWFDFPRTLGLMVLPVASAIAWAGVWRSVGRLGDGRTQREWLPFAFSVAVFTLAFFGLAYSLFPFVVIDRMTIWEAAAHPSALWMLFYGTAVVLPFLAGYTVFAYRVFGGKVKELTYG